jgi:RHS repeat-associated protein
MTSETNPETAGISYTFDSDSTCGASKGDLVKTVDAVGNTTCYSYDALHRNTSATYSGSYASVTPSEYFVYDSATVNGAQMANAKTRLAEAYTCFAPCTSTQTDLGLSYTARGEISDVYEKMPHSSGYYYHVPASYWANGGLNKLNALSNGNPSLPGLPTFTYGADGEGRPTTVSAGSGQNPVTGTTYNLYGTPPQTTVSFGSGDSDVFNADANTGRMTQYKFNVGSNAVTGALTWNSNGTLGKLAITDPLDSSNAQTCNYAHDDLTRIASANCGSIWSQTFSFDAFGNINKTGNSSFGATYSSSTNRMTTIGSSTPTYDANGNVTYDFLHTYTWDANGRPVTIDGIGATYDALGRMVELNRSGVYGEIVYAPSGSKLALMNGQSLSKAFVPLTGGATAVYSSSGLAYYRHSDWLGSSRLATTPTQTMYSDVAYAPYGETYAQSGTADFSFTGMNQDVDQSSNPAVLYDFPAREFGIQGRWPSPDPLGIGAADPSNPQSWNRYAYVGNNPLAATDPTGLFTCNVCFAPPGDPISDIIAAIFDLISFLFELFGGGPPPQAAPAPPGGYGAGIDPYGTWDEKLPKGVQVFPSSITGIPNGSGCTYGSGSCGGMIYGLTAAQQAAAARQRILSYLRWLLNRPWMLSWIVPLAGGEAGVGPAGEFYYNPVTHVLCGGLGAGGSVGRNVSVGPLTQVSTRNRSTVDDIANGWSVSSGATAPGINVGYQVTGNGSGIAGGPVAGSPGISASSTYSICTSPR